MVFHVWVTQALRFLSLGAFVELLRSRVCNLIEYSVIRSRNYLSAYRAAVYTA